MSTKIRPIEQRYMRLAERDGGWFCHYCRGALVPVDRKAEVCTWHPEKVFWDHCGCGEHESAGGPLPMPCIRSAYWSAPREYRWPQSDHVIPRSKGGSDDLSNLVLACGKCNSRKGTKDYEDFRVLEVAR